ncbi:MAG TPA: glycine oxidase ThiO [Thermoanaerobaculia bacterium]|jgi:glycine oxidase|nr:glycine oxidase ThiO [Thermoanaerobaculia bacterium]
MDVLMDAIIVGGGIIGLACARELARAGMKVELLERLPAGAEASLAAAGMLSPMAETLPGPLLDACRESRDLWLPWGSTLAEETGLSVEHDASGSLLVAMDQEDEIWLDRVAAEAREIGEPVEEIDGSVLSRWVPDVSPGVRRSLLLPGEHRVDNVQACTVLAIAARKAGAVLTYGIEVEKIERAGPGVRVVTRDRDVEAGLLVLAAGAWSGTIMDLPCLPVRPVRGQMLLLGGVDWPWNGSFRSQHGYAVRRGATGLLVGATVEEAGFANYNTAGGIESLLRFTRQTLPGLGDTRLEATWAGLRPGTPDGLPILGLVPGWPVIAATGHYRNGILLAPWTAREVARLAASKDLGEAGPFSPARFVSRMG